MMLSAKQVGAMLGLSQSKVYELARRGDIASYRFGRSLRFEPSDVQAVKEASRVPAPRSMRMSTGQYLDVPCRAFSNARGCISQSRGEAEVDEYVEAMNSAGACAKTLAQSPPPGDIRA